MTVMLDITGAVLVALGSLFILSGSVGLVRFPDFYTRSHAVGVTDSSGAGLILVGLVTQTSNVETVVRLILIILFMFLTGPTATHILAEAARKDGVPAWRPGEKRR